MTPERTLQLIAHLPTWWRNAKGTPAFKQGLDFCAGQLERYLRPSETDWLVQMQSLLGQQVRVTLAYDFPPAVAEGQLLSFSEDGQVVILDEVGIKHYCWPNLKTEAWRGAPMRKMRS